MERSWFFGRGIQRIILSELAHLWERYQASRMLGCFGLFLQINTSFPTSNNILLSTVLFI